MKNCRLASVLVSFKSERGDGLAFAGNSAVRLCFHTDISVFQKERTGNGWRFSLRQDYYVVRVASELVLALLQPVQSNEREPPVIARQILNALATIIFNLLTISVLVKLRLLLRARESKKNHSAQNQRHNVARL